MSSQGGVLLLPTSEQSVTVKRDGTRTSTNIQIDGTWEDSRSTSLGSAGRCVCLEFCGIFSKIAKFHKTFQNVVCSPNTNMGRPSAFGRGVAAGMVNAVATQAAPRCPTGRAQFLTAKLAPVARMEGQPTTPFLRSKLRNVPPRGGYNSDDITRVGVGGGGR